MGATWQLTAGSQMATCGCWRTSEPGAKRDRCCLFGWVVHGACRVRGALPNVGRSRRSVRDAKNALPEEGEEAGAGAEAVVGRAGEGTAEEFFFGEEAGCGPRGCGAGTQ